ncbi:GAD-like domain-containing protein [Cellvibrio sp. BR]|uniref:GAD-like domain-containing protein n=1 Tax=Cellvibrio sp. BR TaxID=1134474 RepID=UPI0002600CC5|nr:GAD-like domain-containing protein [Cellvibrio sp. BR]EIK47034.1 GAD-like domain-containing protein [Cellvibrio sp. BR]
MDEYFDEFLNGEGFSPIIDSIKTEQYLIDMFAEKLPNRLLGYWREYGFSGFGEGLMWLVNPTDYDDIIKKYFAKTLLFERENFYVIARTAFGELYVFGDKSKDLTIINPHLNNILPGTLDKFSQDRKKIERRMGIFFMTLDKKILDYKDKSNKALFQRCLKKYGMLEHDEMYTFSPALALGGTADINNIKKVKILEQLSMLCDLDTPVVLPSAGELFGSN